MKVNSRYLAAVLFGLVALSSGCAGSHKRSDQSTSGSGVSVDQSGQQASQQASQQETVSSADQSSQSGSSEAQKAPAGFVLIRDIEFLTMQRLPIAMIDEAQVQLAHNNFGDAATTLQSAARFLRAKSDGLPESAAKSDLMTAVVSLERLAPEVHAMRLQSPPQFSSLMADVAFHLSRYYQLQSQQDWQARNYRLAGHELSASTAYVQSGSKWAGRKADNQRISSIQNVAKQLVKGSGWSPDQVNNAMGQMAQAVQSLGQSLSQAAVSAGQSRETQSGTTSPQQPSEEKGE